MRQFLIIFISSLCVWSCIKDENSTKKTRAKNGMVVSAREEASRAGIEIMKKGGNAFDAMVTTKLTLAVAYPYAGNIAGGGFMVYVTDSGESGALDFREKAPKAAHRDMYLDSLGDVVPLKSRIGALAVGVPGTIAGIEKVHKKFGKLPWEEVVQPAIDLAKSGYVVTKKDAVKLQEARKYFSKANGKTIYYDKEWKVGEIAKPPYLAETLERIQKYGRDGFYKGKTAKILLEYLTERGGIITQEDLDSYEAKWRNPIKFSYDSYEIISMSPPSSGGICLAQILTSIEKYTLENMEHNSAEYIQLLVEAQRRAYADRAHYLGDPDFVNIPVKQLIDKKYNEERMRSFTSKKATPSEDVSHGKIDIVESNETTHFSIVDAFGNAVSVTTTINGAYGSYVFVEKGGFFLNNEMDDFSSKPGVPNMFGLIGGDANAIAPEKRMLSSMTPTILLQKKKPILVLGSPGGSTIITSVLQTILNITEFGMPVQKAVDMPRFHHQWYPDNIKMEVNGFSKETQGILETWGYEIDESDNIVIGKVDAIYIDEDRTLHGGADSRGDDTAVGY